MYCVHQLLPPSVYAHATVMTVVDGQVQRSVIVAVQGARLRAHMLPHCTSTTKLEEELGDAVKSPRSVTTTTTATASGSAAPLEPSSYSLNIGAMVLAMSPCAKGTLLLLTEDNTIALLQLILEDPTPAGQADRPIGAALPGHADVDSTPPSPLGRSAHDKSIRFQLIFQTPVPMESVANRPPTVETSAPVMTPSPCGNLVAFQSYRGWLHVVSVNKALGQLPLEQVVQVLQLEKPTLRDACFVTSTMHATGGGGACEAVFVPVFDRPLQMARGYFINRSMGGSSLVDAVRRWQLPGLPYKSVGLSPLIVPQTATFALLDGVDTSSSHAAFVVQHRDVHTLVYTSLLTKRIVERVPNEVRSIAEVLNLSDQHHKGSGLWLLDVFGGLWRSSLLELDEAVRVGDCEERVVPKIELINFPARPASGPLLYLRATSPPSTNIASALSYSLVVVGDGASVFVVCPHNRMVVRSFLSDGPVVGVSDGPRGALVAVTASGALSMLRSSLAASDHLAAIDMAGVTSIAIYHPVAAHRRSRGDSRDTTTISQSAHVFLVTQWQSQTRALLVDTADGGGIDEVSSHEHPWVAPFVDHEGTLATASALFSPSSSRQQSGLLVCQVTPSCVTWSFRGQHGTAAHQDEEGDDATFAPLAQISAEALLQPIGGADAQPTRRAAVFNHVAFAPGQRRRRRHDDLNTPAPCCRAATFVAASGPHLMLICLQRQPSNDNNKHPGDGGNDNEALSTGAAPQACLLETLPAEVADVACIACHGSADGDGGMEALVASAGWNDFHIRIVRYRLALPHARLGCSRAATAEALVEIRTPHVVRTLTYVALSSQLWFNDASGTCWRYSATQAGDQLDGNVVVVDAAAAAKCSGGGGASNNASSACVVVSEALAFPIVAPVHRDDDVCRCPIPSSPSTDTDSLATPTVVVFGDQDATVVHTLAGQQDTLFSANVQLVRQEGDGGPTTASPLGGARAAASSTMCGSVVITGVEGNDDENTMLLLTADEHRLFVDVVPPIVPSRKYGANGATTARTAATSSSSRRSSSSSRATSPPRQVSLRTSLCVTRKAQAPSVAGPNDRAVALLPVGTSDHPKLLLLSDSARCSTISTIDAATFTPCDAMLLGEHEYAIGVERVPQSDGELVVVATGVCKLPVPADPTSGRILIIGTVPLRFGARYITEREACYCMAVCAAPSKATPTSDSGDAATILIAAGLPSQLLLLRLMGDHLIPVASVPLAAPPSAMSFSYPYVSVSNLVAGSIYFEVESFDAASSMPSSKTENGGGRASSMSKSATEPNSSSVSDVAFRLSQRCMESFAASNVHIDASYAPQRFLRCDTRRNVHFVALEPRGGGGSGGGGPSSAAAGAPAGGVVEDHGGAGITSSPFLPVCVAAIRLSGRPTACYITHSRHSAVSFDAAVAPPARSGAPQAADSDDQGGYRQHHGVASIRGLSSFNFNSDYEPDFTVASTAPRMLIPCDDGSVYVCCGIASEASRLLARLEHAVQGHLNAHAVLRPRNAMASSVSGGFAPAALAEQLPFEGPLAAPPSLSATSPAASSMWYNGVDASIASYTATTAAKSMVRQASRHGMLDRTLLEHFLGLDEATKRRCVEGNEDMQMESSDAVTTEGIAQLVAALTFLD